MVVRAVVAAAVAALASTAALVLFTRARRLVVVDVRGPSMEPTLYDGDRVLVRRAPPTAARTGDLVVVARPDSHEFPTAGPWVIKRVAATAGRLLLLGDNPARSGDSRHWGFTAGDAVLGVVTRSMRARTRGQTS